MRASGCRGHRRGCGGPMGRRRVPRDERLRVPLLGFGDLRRLEPGSIPAASTISCGKTATYVAVFSLEAPPGQAGRLSRTIRGAESWERAGRRLVHRSPGSVMCVSVSITQSWILAVLALMGSSLVQAWYRDVIQRRSRSLMNSSFNAFARSNLDRASV
jgi:hypothetical protein